MSDVDLIASYNYDEFTPEKALPWLNFENSPPIGNSAPDFPLWHLDGSETRLSHMWQQYDYIIVEFGSFT